VTSFALPSPVSAPRSRSVAAGTVTLAVREWGNLGDPTVVLVHGYPDTQDLWTDVAVRLARAYHVVTFDLRGFGSSTPPPEGTSGYALPCLLDDLDAVLRAVAPGKRVHLAGHDWGAILGWEAVTGERFAGRIVSYTAIACPGLEHLRWWIADRARSHPAAAAELVGQIVRSWYVYLLRVPWLPELCWRHVLGPVWGRLPGGTSRASTAGEDGARGAGLYRANVRRPRLFGGAAPPARPPAAVPVQVVVPTHDPFISPRVYDDVDRWVADLALHEIAAGHWVPRTHPGEIAAWITGLVDRVEPRGPDILRG
jgi:pimeloyl-ACP methyl ester carboxylesterase